MAVRAPILRMTSGLYRAVPWWGRFKNAFPLLTYNGTTVDWFADRRQLRRHAKKYKVAQMQTHDLPKAVPK
jgi:hypothetical protein